MTCNNNEINDNKQSEIITMSGKNNNNLYSLYR